MRHAWYRSGLAFCIVLLSALLLNREAVAQGTFTSLPVNVVNTPSTPVPVTVTNAAPPSSVTVTNPSDFSTPQGSVAAAGEGISTIGKVASGTHQWSIRADKSVPIAVTTAVTTQLVGLVAGQAVYVTAVDFMSAGNDTAQFVYGTGTNCATGKTNLTGVYTLSAQSGLSKANTEPFWFVPAGNALCIVTTAATVIGGSLSYTQF